MNLKQRIMRAAELKEVELPSSFEECAGRRDENSRLLPLIEQLADVAECLENVGKEMHEEHCDEDWHCNWCELITIECDKLDEVVGGE